MAVCDTDVIPGNICTRLCSIIKEETDARARTNRGASSSSDAEASDDEADFKLVLSDEIKELIEQVRSQDLNYAEVALEHIQPQWVL